MIIHSQKMWFGELKLKDFRVRLNSLILATIHQKISFTSHIGFESAIGKDCWNLTRSKLADNSPYFETGVKIGFTSKNDKWFFSGLVLNGWQRIQRQDGNNALALGHQITFKPTSKITLNSSSLRADSRTGELTTSEFNTTAILQPLVGLKDC